MVKRVYFDKFDGKGWPSLEQLRPYFLAAPDRRWFFHTGNDGAALHDEAADRSDPAALRTHDAVHLYTTGHPVHGVSLSYLRWDAARQQQVSFQSKGDLTRLREIVHSLHGEAMPVGLFVSFAQAWAAVAQFIETDGALPDRIEWIATSALRPDTWPSP